MSMQIGDTFYTWKERVLGNTGTTIVVAILGGLGVLAAAKFVLPLVNSVLQSLVGTVSALLQLSVYGVLLAVVIMFVSHPRFWTLMWHVRDAVTRSLSNALIKADPIGRLRAFADDYLEVIRAKFMNARSIVDSVLTRIRSRITKQEETQQTNEKQAAFLLKQHSKGGKWDTDQSRNDFNMASQNVKLAERTLKVLREQEGVLEYTVKVLDKVGSALEYRIGVQRATADALEIELISTTETKRALATAAEAWGAGDKGQFDKMVRAYIEEKIAGNVGEITTMLKVLPQLTAGDTIEVEMAGDEMMERLKRLESAADQLSDESKAEETQIASGGAIGVITDAAKRRELVAVPRKYQGLLGTKR